MITYLKLEMELDNEADISDLFFSIFNLINRLEHS